MSSGSCLKTQKTRLFDVEFKISAFLEVVSEVEKQLHVIYWDNLSHGGSCV